MHYILDNNYLSPLILQDFSQRGISAPVKIKRGTHNNNNEKKIHIEKHRRSENPEQEYRPLTLIWMITDRVSVESKYHQHVGGSLGLRLKQQLSITAKWK